MKKKNKLVFFDGILRVEHLCVVQWRDHKKTKRKPIMRQQYISRLHVVTRSF